MRRSGKQLQKFRTFIYSVIALLTDILVRSSVATAFDFSPVATISFAALTRGGPPQADPRQSTALKLCYETSRLRLCGELLFGHVSELPTSYARSRHNPAETFSRSGDQVLVGIQG